MSFRRRVMMGKDPYIHFKDPEVERLCAQQWGSDGKLTYEQAATITSIPQNLFRNNTLIESFDEMKFFISMTEIRNYYASGYGPFQGCTALKSVTLPETCFRSGFQSFYGCTSLETVIHHFTELTANTFYGCTSLKNFDFSTVQTASEGCFRNSGLEGELNIPNLTSIGSHAFGGTKITKIVSLGSITTIPNSSASGSNYGVFGGCSLLEEVNLPTTLVSIVGNAFRACTGIKRIHFETGSALTSFSAFNGSPLLESINLEVTKITSIPANGFKGTALTEITLPSTCISIGNSAFYGCSSLKKVIITNADEVVTLDDVNAFTSTHADLKIYVPDDLVDSYKAAANWSSLASNIHPISEL